jgi:hypothetical protein
VGSVYAKWRSFVRLDHAISQLSSRVVERNDTLNISGRIQNANFARAEAGAVLRVIDCLIFLWEHRLNAGRFKRFPAPTVRFDFKSPSSRRATFPLTKPLCLRRPPWVAA